MAGELRATVLTTVKGDAVKKLQKDLGGLSDSLKGIGGTVSKVAKGFAGFATAIGATKFVTGSIEQAKLLEQTYRSLETVFGPLTGEMERFAEGAAKIGLSQTEAAKASIFIGGVLQQYGVSTDKAAESTQKLVSLAADLSFVYGYDVQEALLGMTALFRGEYDPIEKFGVAMKQNEIESIKAARGLANLTGAAEMNADVLIRQELLFQRTGKSLGAFTENTDTLAVQSEIMRATFENLQATIGQQLTPVITQFFSDLIPIIEEAGPGLVEVFTAVAEVLKGLADIFIDLFDPTTSLGESVVALGAQFESLGRAIFGDNFDIAGIFDLARWAIETVINAIHDLLLMIDTIILYFHAWGILIKAVIEADWDTLAKGIDGVANELYAARDAAKAFDIALQNVRLNPTDLGDTREVWDVLGAKAAAAGKKGGEDYAKGAGDGLKSVANPVKEFWTGLSDEVAKQGARVKLGAMGATEGLIDSILGSGKDWKKVFDNVLKNGVKSLQKAQAVFNKTGAGLKEIQAQAEKLLDVEIARAKQMAKAEPQMESYWDAYVNYLQQGIDKQQALAMAQADFDAAMAAEAARKAEENRRLREEFNKSIKEAFEAFDSTGVVENLGEFTSAARELKKELKDLVDEGLKKDGIGLFSRKQQKQLNDIIEQVGGSLERIGNARDRIASELQAAQDSLAQQQEGRKSLFESIRDSIIGGVNVAQIGGKAETILRTLRKTLKDTVTFNEQLKKLRGMGLSETLIQQIIGSGAQIGGQTAKAIIAGGPKAIEEINNLYNAIGDVASEIGEDAASAMFDAGINTAQGLIDGLLAQEEHLKNVAQQLADAFETAFTMKLNKKNFANFMANIGNILAGLGSATTAPATAASVASVSASRASAPTYNISINPGLVSDPAALGREVVTAIQRYESTSGRVFARA